MISATPGLSAYQLSGPPWYMLLHGHPKPLSLCPDDATRLKETKRLRTRIATELQLWRLSEPLSGVKITAFVSYARRPFGEVALAEEGVDGILAAMVDLGVLVTTWRDTCQLEIIQGKSTDRTHTVCFVITAFSGGATGKA